MPRIDPGRYVDPLRATRTKREVGRLIGCGEPKVDELLDNGTLDFVQIGNRRQVTVASIEKLLGKPIEELERHLVVADTVEG
jgi:hypothetical protein